MLGGLYGDVKASCWLALGGLFVTLSEVSAARSEALTQSKGPYCASTAIPKVGCWTEEQASAAL